MFAEAITQHSMDHGVVWRMRLQILNARLECSKNGFRLLNRQINRCARTHEKHSVTMKLSPVAAARVVFSLLLDLSTVLMITNAWKSKVGNLSLEYSHTRIITKKRTRVASDKISH